MKQIKITYKAVGYPVGSNMQRVKALVNEYRIGFRKLKLPAGTSINLWCRGSSGAILSALFAVWFPQFDIAICHIKKPGENSHSDYPEYSAKALNVIIDDFVSSGETINAIINAVYQRDLKPDVLVMLGASKGTVFNSEKKWGDVFDTIISDL